MIKSGALIKQNQLKLLHKEGIRAISEVAHKVFKQT